MRSQKKRKLPKERQHLNKEAKPLKTDAQQNDDAKLLNLESERKCLVTGERLQKTHMLRFVIAPDGTVTPDIDEKLPGRGMWLSALGDVVKKAERGPFFARSAKRKVILPENLADRVEMLLLKRCVSLIGLAVRSGVAVSGFEKVRIWLKSKPSGVIIAASDGAEDGRSKIRALARNVAVLTALTAVELGQASGREHTVHMVIGPGGLAKKLKLEMTRLQNIRTPMLKDDDAKKQGE